MSLHRTVVRVFGVFKPARVGAIVSAFSAFSAFAAFAACASTPDDHIAKNDDNGNNEVKVDTRSPEARRQYDANVAFASGYFPRCRNQATGRPRVLVTGFGRFMNVDDNATGRILSTLVSSAVYPETVAPPQGTVDPPEPQLSVGEATLTLPTSGEVDVCALILPVYWDLAAIVIAKEIDAFRPNFVMMNGVAGARQDLWIELGATNRAAPLDDGSSQLRPAISGNQPFAKIIESASRAEDARPNLLSWRSVESAAREAIQKHGDEVDQGTALRELLPDVRLAGFPRSSNTYLCNNVTYVTGYLMSHPGSLVRLLRASPAIRGATNDVPVTLQSDMRAVPRAFVHWPSEMATKHHAAGAAIIKAIIDAQLTALARGEAPTLGENGLAAPTLQGGDFF